MLLTLAPLAMIYLLLDEDGRCVLFIVVSIYVSSKFVDYLVGEYDDESNILSRSWINTMDSIYCDDNRSVREIDG